jgi:hypothetical protein
MRTAYFRVACAGQTPAPRTPGGSNLYAVFASFEHAGAASVSTINAAPRSLALPSPRSPECSAGSRVYQKGGN